MMDDIDLELFGDPNANKSHTGGNSQIAVYARIRPWLKKQHSALRDNAVDYTVDPTTHTLSLRIPHNNDLSKDYINNTKETYDYRFAGILNEQCTQADVFQQIGQPAIDNVLQGYNSTIFAYGQTGSGKTYTITGGTHKYDERGIIPRVLAYLYSTIESQRATKVFTVKISYLEIYNENGYDLLHPEHDSKTIDDLPRVTVYENDRGEFIPTNIYAFPADTLEDALNLLFVGDTNRVVCETPSNDASTRSHCIFTIQVESRDLSVLGGGGPTIKRSKLNLVDLAGSERIKKTGVSGKLEREARYINLSLHYLEQLIVALHHAAVQQQRSSSSSSSVNDSSSSSSGDDGSSDSGKSSGGKHIHLPYRNSMMTMMLRDSLGGNCKTIMIATFSMATQHIEETISTARFAQRVAMIRNYVYVNEQMDPQLMIVKLKHKIREQGDEIRWLRSGSGSVHSDVIDRSVSDDERIRLYELIQKFLQQPALPTTLAAATATTTATATVATTADTKLVKLHTLAPYKVAACFDMMKQLLHTVTMQQQQHGSGADDNKENNNGGNTHTTIAWNVEPLLCHSASVTGTTNGAAVQHTSTDYNPAAVDEIKKLRMLVHHRDKEISVLVSMLKNYEAGNIHAHTNGGAAAAGVDNRVYSNATDPMLIAKQQQLLQTLQQQSPATTTTATSHHTTTATTQPQQPAASINPEVLKQRAEAFEVFRKSYRKNEQIEESKASLAMKYECAKGLGETINVARNSINSLKGLLEQRRVEIGVHTQLLNDGSSGSGGAAADGDSNVPVDHEEQRIRQQMEAEKTTYRDAFAKLKALKAEIEHDQQLLERARRKLQQEFDAWWKDHQSISQQINGTSTAAQQQQTHAPTVQPPLHRPPSASASSAATTHRPITSRPPSASYSAGSLTSSPSPYQIPQSSQQQPTALATSQRPQQQTRSQSFTPAPLYPLSRSGSQKSVASVSPLSSATNHTASASPLSAARSPSPSSSQHSIASASNVIQTSTHVLPSTGNAQADADIAAFYRMRDALLASHRNTSGSKTPIT